MTLGETPPLFITLEGIDGCGKSTLARLLQAALGNEGAPTILTREPGGSEGAEAIRALLVKGQGDRWDGLTEYLLLSAARRDHLVRTIWPALEEGTWVICDRFFDSSLAYQGGGHGVSLPFMTQIYETISQGFYPHMTFLLDMDPQKALGRTEKRTHDETRYEKLSGRFFEQVRGAYLDQAKRAPMRYHLLDATKSPQALLQDALKIIKTRIQE